jgi:hypothetical protein
MEHVTFLSRHMLKELVAGSQSRGFKWVLLVPVRSTPVVREAASCSEWERQSVLLGISAGLAASEALWAFCWLVW